MSIPSSSAAAPCWVRHPCLLLGSLQPCIVQSVLLLNRNLPKHTPWHTSSMTTAGRANLLLGEGGAADAARQQKPWEAPSAGEFLTRLRTIFLPWVVSGLAAERVPGAETDRAALTEQILVTTLNRVEEEAHAAAARRRLAHSRISNETYILPAAGLRYRRVPEWVKNPVLLYPDCRGLTVEVIKQINEEMSLEGAWWLDDHMSMDDRVRVIARRIKRLFHWHIDEPGGELPPRPSLQHESGAVMDTWATSPHKTASLVGSIFRRHVAVGIKGEIMKFDYTVSGILTRDRKRLCKSFWDVIRRTMLEIVRNCEEAEAGAANAAAAVAVDTSSETGASSLDDTPSRRSCCSPRCRDEGHHGRAEEKDKGFGIGVYCTAVEELREERTAPEPEPDPPDRTGRHKMSRVVKSRLPTTTGMRRTLRDAASKLTSLVSASPQAHQDYCCGTTRRDGASSELRSISKSQVH